LKNALCIVLIPALLIGFLTTVHAAGNHEPLIQVKVAKTALFDLARRGNGLVAVGERGVVVKSTDGGKAWTTFPTPTTRTLTSVVFVDDKTLVAAGHGATLLRSEDAGTSWQAIVVPEIGKDSILGLLATRDGRVIAYGSFGIYIESADAGKTWQRRTVVKGDFDRHISQVIEVGDKLLLVGESGTLALSPDKGATWSDLKSAYQGSYFGALALPDGAMLIFGMRGNIYRSADGGTSWTHIPIAATSTLNSGSIDANGRVALVGNNGLLVTSSDNGLTFAIGHAPEGLPLASAKFLNDGTLFYVGYMSTGWIKPVEK